MEASTPHGAGPSHIPSAGQRVVGTLGRGAVLAWSSIATRQAGHWKPWCWRLARARLPAALNVHCGHDDVCKTLDTGWIILFGKDAQQAADGR